MAIDSIGKSGPPRPPAPARSAGAAAPLPASAVSAKPSSQQPSTEQVKQAIEAMKQMVEPVISNALDFSIDKETGKTVVRITDAKTGDMIRQIPSEELLDIARSLDKLQGLLLKQKA